MPLYDEPEWSKELRERTGQPPPQPPKQPANTTWAPKEPVPTLHCFNLMFECRRCKKRFYEPSRSTTEPASLFIRDFGLLTTVHQCEPDRVAIADFISADTKPVRL